MLTKRLVVRPELEKVIGEELDASARRGELTVSIGEDDETYYEAPAWLAKRHPDLFGHRSLLVGRSSGRPILFRQ